MKSQLIQKKGQKTYVLILDKGDEVIKGITNFASEQQLNASQFTAIGVFSNVATGFFDYANG